MLKAAITGVRKAELVQAEMPRARDNWVVVRTTIIPMCTEYKAFTAGIQTAFLGHEAVGVVEEVAQPGRVAVGDHVVVMPLFPCGVCDLCVAGDYIHCEHGVNPAVSTGSPEGAATYAEYVVKQDWLLPRIPDDVSDELAGLALCALGPTMGALERMQVDAFDTVLITGTGPVGLGGVVNASYRGARVLVAEGIPWRADKARELGAAQVFDPADPEIAAQIRQATGWVGVDAALDCSGTVAAERLCIDAVRRRGQVAYVGECDQPLEVRISPDMIRKGISIHGSWHYNLNLYPKIVQVLRNAPNAAKLISHILPFAEVQKALEICASHECAKVLLRAGV
ncbi:MAG: zinc-binding dehydrogenase [Chloroflexi bacterium]|nr:zinc-binding dehydrogenase [Chloroflexota bacterium]